MFSIEVVVVLDNAITKKNDCYSLSQMRIKVHNSWYELTRVDESWHKLIRGDTNWRGSWLKLMGIDKSFWEFTRVNESWQELLKTISKNS